MRRRQPGPLPLIAVLLALLAGRHLAAQTVCGPDGCRPANTFPVSKPTTSGTPLQGWWRSADEFVKYADGVVIARFSPPGGPLGWLKADDGTLLKRNAAGEVVDRHPPAAEPAPERRRTQIAAWQTSGVDSTQISRKPVVTFGGKPASDAKFDAALTDDVDRPYLAIVGDKAFHSQAKELLAGKLKSLADEFTVQYFAPDDWHVKDVGLDRPGCHILGPRNKQDEAPAVHFQADLEGLEVPMGETLRSRRRNFDPDKVPDLRSGGPLAWWRSWRQLDREVQKLPGGWTTIIVVTLFAAWKWQSPLLAGLGQLAARVGPAIRAPPAPGMSPAQVQQLLAEAIRQAQQPKPASV